MVVKNWFNTCSVFCKVCNCELSISPCFKCFKEYEGIILSKNFLYPWFAQDMLFNAEMTSRRFSDSCSLMNSLVLSDISCISIENMECFPQYSFADSKIVE